MWFWGSWQGHGAHFVLSGRHLAAINLRRGPGAAAIGQACDDTRAGGGQGSISWAACGRRTIRFNLFTSQRSPRLPGQPCYCCQKLPVRRLAAPAALPFLFFSLPPLRLAPEPHLNLIGLELDAQILFSLVCRLLLPFHLYTFSP